MDGKKEESNPFSFKKFVAGDSQKGKTVDLDDDDDIFKVPDKKQENSKKLLISEDDSSSKKPKKKEKSENPFSFKKFLSGSTKKSTSPSLQIADDLPSRGEENPVFNNLENGLPDFVQDHYFAETQDSQPKTSTASNLSESLEIPLDLHHLNGATGYEISGKGSQKSNNTNINDLDYARDQQRVSENFSDSEDETPNTMDGNVGHILPDFLSGVSVNGKKSNKNRLEVVDDFREGGNHGNDAELSELREENVRLKKQLEVLEVKRRDDAQKISELEKQAVEQRNKELEETSILEKAMEQVEENLRITTQRAVNAEGTITKLKQEIKTIQGELKVLRDQSGQSKTDHLSDVKERTSYVAQELASATKTAESSLKQLLTGVDKLKLLSQVLESVDKITEHKQGDNTGADNT